MNITGPIQTKTRHIPEKIDVAVSCRVCMTESMNMRDLFIKTNRKLIEKIKFCTGIALKEENSLPTQICKNCVSQLSVAYKFKTMCILSEQLFEKFLLKKVKSELSDNFDNDDNIINFEEGSNGECNVKDENVQYDMKLSDIYNIQKDLMSVKGGNDNCEYSIDAEDIETGPLKQSEVQRSKGQKIPKKRKEEENNIKVVKKRGPYKKRDTPRVKKFKFNRLMCVPCGLKFTSKRESDEHKQDVHKEGDSFMCEICGKTFLHRGSHYTHVRSHLPPSLACEHCDYRTGNKYDLEKHIRIHLGIKKFQCAKCPASYHTSSNLRDHERRLHQRLRRFGCHICERLFFDRSKLNRHLDSHNDIKRFECEVCHTAFTRRCYWKKHLERQHSVVVPAERPGRRKNCFITSSADVTA